jgi:hypothetical protein
MLLLDLSIPFTPSAEEIREIENQLVGSIEQPIESPEISITGRQLQQMIAKRKLLGRPLHSNEMLGIIRNLPRRITSD